MLVSDAGKPFQILSDAALGIVGQSIRATDILWDRVWQLERENFGNQEGFLFLPITESVDLSEDPMALPPVAQTELQAIRTDLDRFSVMEINALAQHGYEVARKLCRKKGGLGDAQIPDIPPWAPIPSVDFTAQESSKTKPHKASLATKLSRRLRKSSRRRVWSTFIDWRDWPSYIYVAIAILVFVFLPLQVYQLYRTSQTQAMIIDSIASGDPDIRQILNLATSNPTANWISEKVQEKPLPTALNFEGVEILSHSRIYDLRRWDPDAASATQRGHVYIRDRITLKLLESYSGDGRIIFRFASQLGNVEFRQPKESLQGNIGRVAEPIEVQGQRRILYEFEYDLSQVAREEPTTIELELLLDVPKTVRAPFVTHTKTDMISVWMLFPADRPYKTYSLVSYPIDRSQPPKIMNSRYTIHHPYGSLIGWSVLNPEPDRVYECRWTTE